MAIEKSPCFQFYPRDFMADFNVQRMDWTERGMYVWLLCLSWCEGSIPADPSEIASIFAGMSRDDFQSHWDKIGPCFAEAGGRMIHPRLNRERQKQAAWSEKSARGGIKSAAARRGQGKGGSTVVEPDANIAVCSLRLQDTLPDPSRNPTSIQSQEALVEEHRGATNDFEAFRASYPDVKRDIAVENACRAFVGRISGVAGEFDKLMAGLARWSRSDDWTRSLRENEGRFIPRMDRFISEGRYLDNPPEAKAADNPQYPRFNPPWLNEGTE